MIEKAKTLLLSLTPIALMYIIQIAAALGGQILILLANQFMAMAHVYQSPVLQYAVDQYVYIVSAASYGLFFFWWDTSGTEGSWQAGVPLIWREGISRLWTLALS